MYLLIGPDRKSREERLIDLRTERARTKPLDHVLPWWQLTAGIGCFAILLLAVLALIAGVAVGYLNLM
jgi:hypothetical protein